jgi:AraC-like DNA-binding protein
MARRPTPKAVEWLLRQGDGEQAVPAGPRLEFDNEHWKASIERVDIGEGLRVFLTRAEVRRSLSVDPMQSVPGVWLSSQIALRGRVSVTFAGGVQTQLSPDRSMMCRPSDDKARFTPQPRQTLQLAGYMIRADRVAGLCDGHVPAAIRWMIAPTVADSFLVETPTTPELRRLAAGMFSNRFTGGLRPPWLEGIALQLFAMQVSMMTEGDGLRPGEALSAAERRAVRKARAELLGDMTNPPAAAELAARVGMNERRLNLGFRLLFGATIFETLRNERLDHARIVLERGDLPLKTIAARVGYRHVSNFISAFAARYGEPPRQYVRRRTAAPRRQRMPEPSDC